MRTRLDIGDIVRVHNPFFKDGHKDYPVIKMDGNRATTKFRVFNAKVYNGRNVYEFGKRLSSVYNNTYTVEELG